MLWAIHHLLKDNQQTTLLSQRDQIMSHYSQKIEAPSHRSSKEREFRDQVLETRKP